MELVYNEIKKFYSFLGHKGITELRPIYPRWHKGNREQPPSFFIRSVEELIKNIEKYNGERNIYIGINERKTEGKSDDDVEFITNIGHDIDAHESGKDGLFKAGQIAVKIVEDCIRQGYQEPLIINSGRGYWVIHHLTPIENTEENVKKIKQFGKHIKKKYEIEGIEIDTTVYNPSRIVRVPGTLNVSDENNKVEAIIMNNPEGYEDLILQSDILNIKIKAYSSSISSSNSPPTINSFMDYCLTHELPKGERHKVISRNMAIYISDHPDRELLKQQYCKIQKGSETDLNQWLKNIDEKGKDSFPFSIGELVNFTKKYKIPFDWKQTKEYKAWQKEKKADINLKKEIERETKAEQFGKAIKFFTDKRHLAEQFLNIQPIYYDQSKLWWFWNFDNKIWELCDETDIMNLISKSSEANTVNSREKNEILEALKQQSRLKKPKDIKKTWIQFKDIIVDVLTLKQIDASPEYFTTNAIPWGIGSSEDTPVMDKIFEEWVDEDYTKTLYEIIAYCLIPDYPIHRIFCFIGVGLNGKSKFLDLLRKFVGNNNCTSTDLDILMTSRFEVTRLYKKLVCQMGETNFGELSKTSMLKKLSGGDLIGFEYKNKTPFEDKNYAKILISTNNLPTTTDKTIGFYRRWMIIDFPNRFNEKKEILEDIPEEEYSNLAFKCLQILQDLLKKREFHKEGTIEERIERYEAKSNFIGKFVKDFTVESINDYITKSSFYKKFIEWCKENRHREMSEIAVGLTMKKMGMLDDRKYFDWLYDGKGGQARVWSSIKWRFGD